MSQFVKIRQTFINLELIRLVSVEAEIPKITVFWSAGDSEVYINEQAELIIGALEHLKMLSVPVPGVNLDTLS